MTPSQYADLYKRFGSVRAVCGSSGLTYYRSHLLYQQCVQEGLLEQNGPGHRVKDRAEPVPVMQGQLDPRGGAQLRRTGTRQVFVFTAAQNNTYLHNGFWRNLEAYVRRRNANLYVGRYTYCKNALNRSGEKETQNGEISGSQAIAWDPRIEPYTLDERAEIARGLWWCGEMNILPTAVRPLSGLDVYTGVDSAIFPHAKLALQSVATSNTMPAKMNYTTGTVTQVNYIGKKAGLKAQFHHSYSALVVEVEEDETWFVRQLVANKWGDFQDLNWKVQDGQVVDEQARVSAINWGDIHFSKMDPAVAKIQWGPGGIAETLRPQHQFLHDLVDFGARSHHNLKDPHLRYYLHRSGEEDVSTELRDCTRFIREISDQDLGQIVVVDSNHHHHIGRWAKEAKGQEDPVNAKFWMQLNAKCYADIDESGGPVRNYLLAALEVFDPGIRAYADFLDEDEGYVIEKDHDGIECGMHGHAGPGGSRGSANNLARCGLRANIGHTHKAEIHDGVYVAGTCGPLDEHWTHGPGAWSHSLIVTYPGGKRAIVTISNGRWRVP